MITISIIFYKHIINKEKMTGINPIIAIIDPA